MSHASPLHASEAAFHAAPSLDTARAWHSAALRAYGDQDIDIRELQNIGNAVRTFCRINNIDLPSRAP